MVGAVDKVTIARECFYLPDGSSIPHWRVRPIHHFATAKNMNIANAVAGKPAGSTARKDGRRRVLFVYAGRRISMYAYHIVWALKHGQWPKGEIDHRDVDPTNDNAHNLRNASHKQNIGNTKLSSHNTSGSKGVSWRKDRQKWRAYIKVSGLYQHLGHFDKREDAEGAYLAAASAHFGSDFARLR